MSKENSLKILPRDIIFQALVVFQCFDNFAIIYLAVYDLSLLLKTSHPCKCILHAWITLTSSLILTNKGCVCCSGGINKNAVCKEATFCSFVIFKVKQPRDAIFLLVPRIQTYNKCWEVRNCEFEPVFQRIKWQSLIKFISDKRKI